MVQQVRGAAWRAAQADTPVAAELERFGAEGVRAMLRGGAQGERATTTTAERQVAAIIVAASSGERADAAEVANQREAERLTQRRGLRM